ncbi:MAG: ggt [Burkholderiaceae bacterium]|nr:ggt [Burkholderiaceae bacterium]
MDLLDLEPGTAGRTTTMRDVVTVNLESGFAGTTLRALVLKRHTLGQSLSGYDGFQAIMRLLSGAWAGASESRQDGHAAGY